VVSIGEEIVFQHILGDPRGREYEDFRLLDRTGDLRMESASPGI
jgi:hypothetical protein